MLSTPRLSNYDCCVATMQGKDAPLWDLGERRNQPSTAFVDPLSIAMHEDSQETMTHVFFVGN